MSSPLLELPFALQLQRGLGPLHQQLAEQLRQAVLSGKLPADTLLPGTRTLGAQLGVTRGVVAEAYSTLTSDGTLEAVVGQGTRVRAGASRPALSGLATPRWFTPPGPAPVDTVDQRPGIHFKLGVATMQTLDIRAWRQAWAHAARVEVSGDYPDVQGEPRLRAALAAFVGRSRGLATSAEQLLITCGTVQAIRLISALLPPRSPILFEASGYRAGRQVLLDAGHQLHYLAVDDDGPVITPDTPAARLAYVTPSHQFPLGGRMCLPRRLALLDWAERHDALILEDDYDGEFRYDAAPLPTLASLDTRGRVLYLGTLSKVLTPTIRTGFLIAPETLMPTLVRARTLLDFGHPQVVQSALEFLLSGGHVDKHIRRTRRWHAQVREVLTQELALLAPQAVLGGIEAGLHVCLYLDQTSSATELAERLAQRGVYVSTLESYTFAGPVPNALLLGYGGLNVAQARAGAREIVKALRVR